MVQLDLRNEQANMLGEILEHYLSDLRMEIVDTEGYDFKKALKQREAFLKDVLSRLGDIGGPPPAAPTGRAATTAAHVRAMSRSIQKTNQWIKEVTAEMGSSDPEVGYAALRATLPALRDRLIPEEAAQLAAQLPTFVRGLYFEGWDPVGKPTRERHREEFLAAIDREFRERTGFDPLKAARAVFAVLAARVSAGEIRDVIGILPRELRDLWPAGTAN